MARSRNIKPGFFTNEELVELPFEARLLFIGLWCIADREGRLEYRPKKIKMQVFPADDVDIESCVSGLHGAGMVQVYAVDNTQYLQITNFHKHQNPHIKEQQSTIPAPDMHGASPADSLIPLTDSLSSDSPNNAGVETPTESPPKREPCPYQKIIDLYHEKLPMCPRVVTLTDSRKRSIKARWGNGMYGLDNWKLYFDDVAKSKFLTGKTDPSPGRKQFIADIDFLIRESTITKTQEGKYHG